MSAPANKNKINNRILSSGPRVLQDFDQRYVHRLIQEAQLELQEEGDRKWMVDASDGSFNTISSIQSNARKAGSFLRKLGFKSGDILQTGYSTCLDFYWPIFGAWMCDGVVSLCDPNLQPSLIRQQILDLKSKFLVCSSEFLTKYMGVLETLDEDLRPQLFVLDTVSSTIKIPASCINFQNFHSDDGIDVPEEVTLPAYESQQLAVVFWTAGTTGHPKGILHSHQMFHNVSFLKNICNSSLITNVGYHMAGFLQHLATGIGGRTVSYFIKEKDFSGDSYLDALERYEIEYFVCSVASFTSILKAKHLERSFKLKVVTPIGGQLSPPSVTRVMKIFGTNVQCIKIYGGTELGFIAKGTFNEDYTNIGVLGPGVEIYIADFGSKSAVGPNIEGNMMVKTKNMMLGYLNEKDNLQSYDAAGFIKTGDVGFYDAEGCIHLTYRKKDVLKVENCWFGPAEVEQFLDDIPGVLDSIVWGEYDNTIGSDIVNVGVVMSQEKESLTAERIKALVEDKLPRTRHVSGKVYFLQSIPHSGQGKKLRREIRKFVMKEFSEHHQAQSV